MRFVAIADVRESARETVKSTSTTIYKNTTARCIRDPGRAPGAERYRRAPDRHQRPLARAHGDVGGAVGQGHVHREARRHVHQRELCGGRQRPPLRRRVPVGRQRKNQFSFEFAVGLARSGKLGRLLAVHADTAIGLGTVDAGGHGWWPAETPEPDPLVFDWDKWLGPCLWRPWNSSYPDRGRGEFWDFHAGLLEWASHTVAMAQWAADMEHTEPVEYVPGRRDLPRRRTDRALHDLLQVRQRRATDPAESQLGRAGLVQQPVRRHGGLGRGRRQRPDRGLSTI